MQTRMTKLQDELGTMTVTGTSGGGAVAVTANGQQQIQGVVIDAEALGEGRSCFPTWSSPPSTQPSTSRGRWRPSTWAADRGAEPSPRGSSDG